MDDNINMSLDTEFTGLVFNDTIDTSNMTNVLLIDSIVADKQQFYDSVNANTFPIIYSYNSSTDELLALFRQKFPASSIQRISLVFHDRGPNVQAPFMNNKIFFEEADLEVNQTNFTENVSFLITCIKEFRVGHIDFLACNTLQYSNWKSYYALLASQTAVVVGASNDQTGNLNHGGDWVMESTSEDVMNIYFNANISNYTSTLVLSTITLDGANGDVGLRMNADLVRIDYYNTTTATWIPINSGNWPVQFVNSTSASSILRIVATQNLTITNTYGGASGYFIAGSTNITFDGSGNTITIRMLLSSLSYPGFIQNGTSGANGFANVVVQNFITDFVNIGGGSGLGAFAGWLCQAYFGKGVIGNEIRGCRNTGTIYKNSGFLAIYAGGIVGGYAGSSGGLLNITNCSNTGVISASYAGGIVGGYAGSGGGLLNITNCSNTGGAISPYTGGIAGYAFGYNTSSTCVISGCYSTGNISGSNAGGIVGSDIGYNNSASPPPVVNITNSYSLGTISTTCGGICGGTNGNAYIGTPTINISNCYSWGLVTDASSGIVATSLPITPNQSNTYVANTSWTDASANASLTSGTTPTNINTNNPGSIWTTTGTNVPYVLSSFNAQLYNPNSASSTTPYTSAPSVFGSSSGYTYTIVYSSQVGSTITTRVFVSKGTSTSPYYYYSYNFNTFVFTNTASVNQLNSSIYSSNGILSFSYNGPAAICSVSYDGNTNTSGSAPVDGLSPYEAGSSVSVLGNTGSLAKTCFTFAGWNTLANGTGTAYSAGDTFTINANTILYAQWSPIPYTITYNGNTNTSGTAPVDGLSPYNCGSSVSVLGNTGSLVKPCFTFTGWNTLANGAGTAYSPTSTFSIYANTILYAQWELINTTCYCPVPKIKGLYYPTQEQLYKQFKNENCNIQKKLPGTLGGRYVGALSGAMRKSQWIGLGTAARGQTRFVLNADELGMRQGQPGGILPPVRNRF